jgi:hypothetical protein
MTFRRLDSLPLDNSPYGKLPGRGRGEAMSARPNVMCQIGTRQVVNAAKCSWGRSPKGEMFVIRNVRGAKCPRGESRGESYDKGSGPISKITYGFAEILSGFLENNHNLKANLVLYISVSLKGDSSTFPYCTSSIFPFKKCVKSVKNEDKGFGAPLV